MQHKDEWFKLNEGGFWSVRSHACLIFLFVPALSSSSTLSLSHYITPSTHSRFKVYSITMYEIDFFKNLIWFKNTEEEKSTHQNYDRYKMIFGI